MNIATLQIQRFFDGIWAIERRYDGIFKTVGLIAAAAFAVHQYDAVRSDGRIERTMKYIERYEDGSVAKAREDIQRALRYISARSESAEPGFSEREAVITLTRTEEFSKLENNIDAVADFFTGLRTCVENKLCDGGVALKYFGSAPAKKFIYNMSSYIALRRGKDNTTYACDVAWFNNQGRPSNGCP